MKLLNLEGYALKEDGSRRYAFRERRELSVTFITDLVPGAYHQPIDLMNWMLQNPYVEAVELVELPTVTPLFVSSRRRLVGLDLK
jgi:hypothetical protein